MVANSASIPVMDIVQYTCVAKDLSGPSLYEEPGPATSSLLAANGHGAALNQPALVVPSESLVSSGSLQMNLRRSDDVIDTHIEPEGIGFIPSIRSGSFADIGHRTYMEDEHICIDDLSAHMGSTICCPSPSAFYGVFDGHGGADAATYVKEHAIKFFFENVDFPCSSKADNAFLQKVEYALSKAFLHVDNALANEFNVSSSSGTTGLTALVFGRVLLVANVGDCRAVLCRKGKAIDMSEDHKPTRLSERMRVEAAGAYIDDGYLNGVLSVTRALGDWDLKLPWGSRSPLIAEPEFEQVILTEDDEFLIIGCDGIWDVMTSQHAVSIVRRGLRRHNDPAKCARELALEALYLHTADNLTVVVICFMPEQKDLTPLVSPGRTQPVLQPKLSSYRLSAEALCKLSSWLSDDGNK